MLRSPPDAIPLGAPPGFSSLDLVELGSLADIAFHGQEGFVIGDGTGHQLFLLDRPGATPRKLTGPGRGPGEIGMVNAVTTAGPEVIVRDASPDRTFQLHHPDGGHLASAQAPVPGDRSGVLFRQVQTRWDARQSGPEHSSDRLVRADSARFIHILQDDERELPRPPPGTPIEGLWTTAIRYDLSGPVVDTVGRLPAPATRNDRASSLQNPGRGTRRDSGHDPNRGRRIGHRGVPARPRVLRG